MWLKELTRVGWPIEVDVGSVTENVFSTIRKLSQQRSKAANRAYVNVCFCALFTRFSRAAEFGKSLIYQLAPMVTKMGRNENPVVVVVSPLVAFITK